MSAASYSLTIDERGQIWATFCPGGRWEGGKKAAMAVANAAAAPTCSLWGSG